MNHPLSSLSLSCPSTPLRNGWEINEGKNYEGSQRKFIHISHYYLHEIVWHEEFQLMYQFELITHSQLIVNGKLWREASTKEKWWKIVIIRWRRYILKNLTRFLFLHNLYTYVCTRMRCMGSLRQEPSLSAKQSVSFFHLEEAQRKMWFLVRLLITYLNKISVYFSFSKRNHNV